MTQYSKENKDAFIKDVLAMANSHHEGSKYIILGVKDKPGYERLLIGIESESFIDSSIYQEWVYYNIETDLKLNYFPLSYEDKILGIIEIFDNNNRPYLLKKDLGKLESGSCYIRKGSRNVRANRRDYDAFYKDKEYFEIKIDNYLRAVEVESGCALLKASIRNLTQNPVVIHSGCLYIKNKVHQIVTQHPLCGLNKYIGADFQINLNPKTEVAGDLFLDFSSSDCVRLGMDEYGTTESELFIELELYDTQDNKYFAESKNVNIYAKNDFLWKVKLKK